jgi:hypothetical protein
MSEQLLVAVFAQDIRDDLIDALIGLEAISGFNLETIDGYGREHSRYDLREQVAGYRQLCRLEVLHESDQEQALLATLARACAAGHLRYWVMPLKSSGQLP